MLLFPLDVSVDVDVTKMVDLLMLPPKKMFIPADVSVADFTVTTNVSPEFLLMAMLPVGAVAVSEPIVIVVESTATVELHKKLYADEATILPKVRSNVVPVSLVPYM